MAAPCRTDVLRHRLDDLGDPHGASMRMLVAGLRVVDVAAQSGETLDCDTWSDVDRARMLLEGR